MSDSDLDPQLHHFHGRWEVDAGCKHEITVNVNADQNVIVDKVFGPQSSSCIRVRHIYDSCEWIVEEQNFNNDEWVERARFDAQEFYKDKYLPLEEAP